MNITEISPHGSKTPAASPPPLFNTSLYERNDRVSKVSKLPGLTQNITSKNSQKNMPVSLTPNLWYWVSSQVQGKKKPPHISHILFAIFSAHILSYCSDWLLLALSLTCCPNWFSLLLLFFTLLFPSKTFGFFFCCNYQFFYVSYLLHEVFNWSSL